jgi:pyruvate carboxylase
MKIQIQENEILLVSLGTAHTENRVTKREVTFEINGEQFTREILLEPNGTGADYQDPQKFYMMNKEMVDASLVEFLSDHQLYNNR